jgi:hypothetical protein
MKECEHEWHEDATVGSLSISGTHMCDLPKGHENGDLHPDHRCSCGAETPA